VRSAAVIGVEGIPVTVEADVGEGFPRFLVVGLPDAAVRESKERVISAIRNVDARVPFERVVVNLAPADVRKEGTSFDLPMAIAVLAAAGLVPPERVDGFAFIGELSLDGRVHAVRGALAMALALSQTGQRRLVLPTSNVGEAAMVEGLVLFAASHLREILSGKAFERPASAPEPPLPSALPPDLADVRGNDDARRAIEIAAAGGHHLALIGPPGVGKTMLARRLPGILPALSSRESLEVSRIHSVGGLLCEENPRVRARPFRAPHHTVSAAGLLGGGAPLRPGEVSLAHRGVLFLDELPEMRRDAIDGLRQPLEEGVVRVTRANARVTLPATFQLVVAMNPCPCGFLGHPSKPCTCATLALRRYRARISGPIVDRIDLFVSLAPVRFAELRSSSGEGTSTVRDRVLAAHRFGQERAGVSLTPAPNAGLPIAVIRDLSPLSSAAEKLLEHAVEKLAVSARGHDRLVRVAKTIADLAGSGAIDAHHVAEALHYRRV